MSESSALPEFDAEVLSAYLDGELNAEQSALVEHRLAEDPAARQLLAELESVSRTLKSLPREQAASVVRAQILTRISEESATPPVSDVSTLRRWMWPAVAVAAALLLMFVQRDEVDHKGAKLAQVEENRSRADETDKGVATIPAPGELNAAPEPSVEENSSAPAEAPALASEATAPSHANGIAPTREPSGVVPLAAARATGEGQPATAAMRDELLATEPDDRSRSSHATADELGLVHITLNDQQAGAEQFDRLLVANGVQVISGSAGEVRTSAERGARQTPDGEATLPATDAGVGRAMRSAPALRGGRDGTAGSQEAKMVLVEAPAEQIGQILEACKEDSKAFGDVVIDESPAQDAYGNAASQWGQFRRYEKLSRRGRLSNQFEVTPAQQQTIITLNSLYQTETPYRAESASSADQDLPATNQGWAVRMGDGQQPTEYKQLEDLIQNRRGQLKSQSQPQPPTQRSRKVLAKKDATPQQLRVLFLLHPNESSD